MKITISKGLFGGLAVGAVMLGAASCQAVNKMPLDKEMAAYLLVYFSDADHSLHMALSSDGYSFTALNDDQPVINGEEIAEQKGIRDPHILRGPDNTFYMAMTDLHIYGQRKGFRNTRWQRDGNRYGWGNNRSLVLMKSQDLINWTHTNLRVDTAFPGFEEIGCAWAPELIYDEKEGKIMVYFTIRFQNGKGKVYYAYLNDALTRMVDEPKVLFEYPGGETYIDSDITKVGDKFHMFYVSHDGTPGIKQAVSDSINSGYVYDPKWIDSEEVKCEAPNVWKRIVQDKWVLMYDIYGLNPPKFGFCETSDFLHFTDIGRFNEGVMKATNFSAPKHGAIIHLTADEAARLADHWKMSDY